LVDLLAGHKAIMNKWVLKIKRRTYGSIERYKAPLAAKGYTKQKGKTMRKLSSQWQDLPQFA